MNVFQFAGKLDGNTFRLFLGHVVLDLGDIHESNQANQAQQKDGDEQLDKGMALGDGRLDFRDAVVTLFL